MSEDPHSGIDRAYLLDHLPERVLTEQVQKALEAQGKGRLKGKSGRCPFPQHVDRKPSFSVTEGEGWKCKGCNLYGKDVISFIMQLRGYASVDDAIVELAREYGIARPSEPRRARLEAPRRLRNTKEVLDHLEGLPDYSALSESLHSALLSEAGGEARAYLEGRGISEASWIRHGLGYVAPGSHPPAPLWAEWEGTVVFPIRAGEHVINFAGRRIREEQGKPDKLNCDSKRCERWPFNMNALLLEQETPPTVYVCEGPISALALEEMGQGPAVALLGKDIPEKWWPLFSREYPIVLVLDADSGEETPQAVARKMRRLGWWRYILMPPGMDPADLWKASGFSAREARPIGLAHELAYNVILSGPPGKDTAESLAFMVAKSTRGLTLTLRFEDGPHLGYYLEFTRADGRAFSLDASLQPETRTSTALSIYAWQEPTPASEDVYVRGELEANLQLRRAIKKLRPRLKLAVADGLSPDLLSDKGRGRRQLAETLRVPTETADKMSIPRARGGKQEVAIMEIISPQSGPVRLLPLGAEGTGQLTIPGLYERLIPSDTKLILGVFRLHATSPGLRQRTTFEEFKEAAGVKGQGGHVNDQIWEGLNRVKTWWYSDYNPKTGEEWSFNFISGLKRDPRGRDTLEIDISLRLHESLTGRLYEDYIEVNWPELENLSPQAVGAYIAICAHKEPRRWLTERVASAISSNQRPHKARAEALAVLKELEDAGLLLPTERKPTPTGKEVLCLVKAGEAGRRLPWEKAKKAPA